MRSPERLAERFRRLTGRRGFSWLVRADLAEALFDDGEFLPARRVLRRLEIKEAPFHRVWAVDLAGPEPLRLIVKSYPARPWPDGLLRGILFPSTAEIERRSALVLIEKGIEAAAPIAAGRRWAGFLSTESILVTERCEGARDLRAALREGPWTHAGRISLIRALADLLRRLHAAGVLHEDLHLGNLLLAGGPGEKLRIIPVDLRRVRIRRALTERSRARNLAILWNAALGLSTRADRRRFLEEYLGAGDPGAARHLLDAVGEIAARHLIRSVRRRARREIRDVRRIERRLAGGIRWLVRPSGLPGLEALLADPESAFADAAAVIKSGRSGAVARQGGLILKRFRQKRLRNLIADRLRGGRGRRNLEISLILERLGIPTARAVAAGERRVLGLATGGYLVTEEIRGAATLLERVQRGPPDAALLKRAGRLVARLHESCISHRDLKALNLLVDPAGRLHLVDLDGIRILHRKPGLRRRARDLDRLLRDLPEGPGGSPESAEETIAAYCEHAAGIEAASLRLRLARERDRRLRKR